MNLVVGVLVPSTTYDVFCREPRAAEVGPRDCEWIAMVEEIRLHNQLRLVTYPAIYKVSYIPGGTGFLPSTVVNDIFS